MKKFILGITTLICYSTMAQGFEANIKVGYDFYRYSNYKLKTMNGVEVLTDEIGTYNYGRGFVVGVEALPLTFKDERIKLGVGLEYNFGEKTVYYSNKNINYKSRSNHITMMPLYATAKFTYYRPKNINLNLYTFARLGYAFSTAKKESNDEKFTDNSGFYYGLGLGMDYKYFLAEILYDGKYRNYLKKSNYGSYHSIDIHHKVGIRLGVQLGSQYLKKVQIISCEPKVIEKKTTNKIIIKKFDISAQALFEFNKYELQDLKENGKKEIEKKVKELQKSGFEITGINVIGHTDRLGTDEYNYNLGLNRANTIREYLKELGIKVEIKSISKGKTEPKVHCNNVKSTSKLRECLQPNRRVEIQFLGLETEQKVEEVIENK